MRKTVVVLGLLLGGCAPGGSRGALDGGQPLGRVPACTPSCIAGWWFSAGEPCQVYCTGANQTPECSLADCSAIGVNAFLPDGGGLSTEITLSASRRQFSAVDLSLTPQDWSLSSDGTTLNLNDPTIGSSPQEICQCQANTLYLIATPATRQSPPISTALQGAAEAGQWTAVHY